MDPSYIGMTMPHICEEQSPLVRLCIEAATESKDAIDAWKMQRRTLERMPSQLIDILLHRLLHRRILYPSLLEVFKYSAEHIDLRGEVIVDAEWMAYLGGFLHLRKLILADCNKISSSAIWPISGMATLKVMDLSRCSKINDAGIEHLLSIQSLEELYIPETGVTSRGISLLSSLTNLHTLDLGGLPVTDVALSSLRVLTKLQYLDLWGSAISNEGVNILKMFPKLTVLTLAWTKITHLPDFPSIACLNMSNCTIHSIFEGYEDKAPLTKLVLSGATFDKTSEVFAHVETLHLSFLDVSNTPFQNFGFLKNMNALEHLDLSSTVVGDDSVHLIASIGNTLRSLNLNKTRITSSGLSFLAGNVPNLEKLTLYGTYVDDTAISFLCTMPSLKLIDLSETNVKGLIRQDGDDSEYVFSLTELHNLSYLETLNLEKTQIRDASLLPLNNLKQLSCLSLRSDSLTDLSLYHLSSIPNLKSLSIRDAVLTDGGLGSFNPQLKLVMLDLRECWLLTKDALLLFCNKHPQIEVRHELINISRYNPTKSISSSSKVSSKGSSPHLKQKRGKLPVNFIIDQRLKYNREELLALQFSSASLAAATEHEKKTTA
ncbi:toll-like receptor 13 isoform X2 [Impatiens glandulifera]|uniref:toll-like receptor 13 isoform X2 n=1 Tax=Impatiens glandulifera TaxID=253017 RepID=UPI001FB18DE4|nr:toll-like receptor 13 isoform X2 [Impatiens glandulifera]